MPISKGERMLFSKSIVLNSVDNSLKKAVLKIQSQSGNVTGQIRLYNFREEPLGTLTLGLLVDGKVQKAQLKRTGYMEYGFGSIFAKIPSNCTCAVVSSVGGKNEPTLLGAINQNAVKSEDLLLEALSVMDASKPKEVEEILNQNHIEYEDSEEIEKEIDKCMTDCASCEKCVYKDVFYAEQEKKEEKEPPKLEKSPDEEKIQKGQLRVPNVSHNFIDEIGGQIDLLFEKYPVDEVLTEIIPNSKWVKVDYNNDKKFYVVGLIYDDNTVKYVCYGLPAKWTEKPPSDFNESAQWLPIDLADPKGEGYWITYQDANNGELIRVNII